MEILDQNPLLRAFRDTGDFGTYQIGVFTMSLLASFLAAPVYVDTYLLTYPMAHRCKVSACESDENSYNESFVDFAIPLDEETGERSSCEMYSVTSDGCSRNSFSNSSTETCVDGWVYDTSLFTSTAVKDFDLVCGRETLRPMVASVNMVGIMLGCIVAGNMGDKMGRKAGLLASVVSIGLGGILGALSNSYMMFLVARVFAGAGGGGVFLTTFVLAAENVGSTYRTVCGVIIMIPFALGEAVTGILGYFIRNWRVLQLCVTLPSLVMVTYFWLLPESVRWLVLQKQNMAALSVIKKAAKINKRTLDSNLLLNQINASEQKEEIRAEKSLTDLLKAPQMRKRSLNLFFCWIVCTLVYYGLSSNSGSLAGNFFLNFIATMLIEIPSYIFTCFILDRMGRKGTLVSVMVLGGLASLICGSLEEDMVTARIVLSLAGKFGISSAFSVIFVYSVELFPTEYRAVGLGSCSMCARIGGIMAPLVGSMSVYYTDLPLLVFGILSITSGMLVSLLPETKGYDLPQTLEESEKFGENQSFCYFSCINVASQTEEDELQDKDETSIKFIS